MSNKVALVTGASSGIGYDTAIELKHKGFVVYAAARRMDAMKELENLDIKTISLDVTKEESMIKCVETILTKEGRLDVLVNNAGYGSYGAIEDVPIEEARKQMEVNVFGLAKLTQLVLPKMRENRYGKIVNISSVGGKITTSFGGWYHATKFALEAFSDCLRMEVEPFGIDVIIIEPGGIRTSWGIIAAENLEKISGKGAYKEMATKTAQKMKDLYQGEGLSDPRLISTTIVKAVMKKKPKTRYLIGYMAKPALMIKRIVSDRMFDKMIKKING